MNELDPLHQLIALLQGLGFISQVPGAVGPSLAGNIGGNNILAGTGGTTSGVSSTGAGAGSPVSGGPSGKTGPP